MEGRELLNFIQTQALFGTGSLGCLDNGTVIGEAELQRDCPDLLEIRHAALSHLVAEPAVCVWLAPDLQRSNRLRSQCTSLGRCETFSINRSVFDNHTPLAFLGGSDPGSS
jgi:hypothetical protein